MRSAGRLGRGEVGDLRRRSGADRVAPTAVRRARDTARRERRRRHRLPGGRQRCAEVVVSPPLVSTIARVWRGPWNQTVFRHVAERHRLVIYDKRGMGRPIAPSPGRARACARRHAHSDGRGGLRAGRHLLDLGGSAACAAVRGVLPGANPGADPGRGFRTRARSARLPVGTRARGRAAGAAGAPPRLRRPSPRGRRADRLDRQPVAEDRRRFVDGIRRPRTSRRPRRRCCSHVRSTSGASCPTSTCRRCSSTVRPTCRSRSARRATSRTRSAAPGCWSSRRTAPADGTGARPRAR